MEYKGVRAIRPESVAGHSPRDAKEGNVLFNDALNTFYLRLYGVGALAMVCAFKSC